MALPPRDHRISLEAAAALTRRYREAGKGAERAGSFHAGQVREMLAEKGCVALRIYYGKHEDGRDGLVLVGVDADDKDMTGSMMLEFQFPCPPYCTDGSPLNA